MWNFRSYATFQTVFRLVPSIKGIVVSVSVTWPYRYLRSEEDDIAFQVSDVLVTLSACRNLTTLALRNIYTKLHLDHFAILFPRLQDLTISTSDGASFYGSLAECSTLKSFRLCMWIFHMDSDIHTMDKFFPMASSQTLSSLFLDIFDTFPSDSSSRCFLDCNRHCIFNLLQKFERLEKLCYAPTCNCLYQFMKTTKATVTTFVSSLWDTSSPKFANPDPFELYNIFTSPSLKNLRELVVGGNGSRPFDDETLIDAITENILSLEELYIRNMRLELSWVHKFNHLTSLRSLHWEVDVGVPIEGGGGDSVLSDVMDYDEDEFAETFGAMLRDSIGKQADELEVRIILFNEWDSEMLDEVTRRFEF